MRVLGWRIDGFGALRDVRADGLPPGLTLIEGENGSGKTTLLAFLRAVLFGLPRAGGATNRYEPPPGVRHGGRIDVEMCDGRRYRIERHVTKGAASGQATVVSLDGAGPTDLGALLGRATDDLFCNAFAFGLKELASLDKDVQARLHAAATGAGAVSVFDALKRLNDSAASLFAPGGRKPAINDLLGRHREVEDGLRSARAAALQAPEHERREEELERKSQRVEKELEQARAQERELDMVQRALPVCEQLREARAALEALPPAAPVPEGGVETLERLLAGVKNAHDRRTEAEARLASQRASIEAIAVDEAVRARRGAIEDGARRVQQAIDADRDLPLRRAEERAKAEEVADGLRRLGEGWTEERATSFDDGLPVEQAVAEADARLREREETRRQREAEARAAGARVHEEREKLAQARAGFEARWPAPPRDRAAVEADVERAVRARTLAQSLGGEEGLRALEADRRAAESELARVRAAGPTAPPPPRLLWAVAAIAALALLLTVALQQGAVAIAATGLVASAAAVAALLARRAARAPAVAAHAAAVASAEKVLREAESRLQEERAERERRRAELAPLLDSLGLPPDAGLPDIERVAERLNDERQGLDLRERDAETVRDAERTLERVERASEAAQRALAEAEQAVAAERSAWQAWLADRSLPVDLTPAGMRDMVAQVREVRRCVRERDALRQRIAAMEDCVAGFRNGVLAIAETTAAGASVNDLVAELEQARRRLEQADAAAAQRDALLQGVPGLEATLAVRRREEHEAVAALRAVLDEAGVENEEAFRERARQAGARRDAESRVRHLEAQLGALAGPAGDPDRLEAEVARWNTGALQAEIDRLRSRIEELQTEQRALASQLGEVTKTLHDLLQSERIETLGQERAGLAAEIAQNADTWAELKVCAWLLGRAREKFERERQPEVVRRAGAHVREVTGGAYEGLFAVQGEGGGIEAVAAGGDRKEQRRWNQGLLEQIYLCLRLGFIEDYARSAEPLPVVMDDILANSDPDHARRAAALIAAFARSYQVLYLTCHPETAGFLRAAEPGLHHLRLRGGGIDAVGGAGA